MQGGAAATVERRCKANVSRADSKEHRTTRCQQEEYLHRPGARRLAACERLDAGFAPHSANPLRLPNGAPKVHTGPYRGRVRDVKGVTGQSVGRNRAPCPQVCGALDEVTDAWLALELSCIGSFILR